MGYMHHLPGSIFLNEMLHQVKTCEDSSEVKKELVKNSAGRETSVKGIPRLHRHSDTDTYYKRDPLYQQQRHDPIENFMNQLSLPICVAEACESFP